jgi:protein involved in polysaccharide export with SLBB domain
VVDIKGGTQIDRLRCWRGADVDATHQLIHGDESVRVAVADAGGLRVAEARQQCRPRNENSDNATQSLHGKA